MINLKKLYLEADSGKSSFEDVIFNSGLNIILGEESDEGYDKKQKQKTNGVGKSLIVEILDYCLMADLKGSRLSRLPIDLLDEGDFFCLDFTSVKGDANSDITIKRSRKNNGSDISIITDGDEVKYTSIEDAKAYLEQFFVVRQSSYDPSLRQILSILLRKEDTLYGDIFYTNSESKRFNYSELIKPHMYLFGVNLKLIDDIKLKKLDIKDIGKMLSGVRKEFKLMNVTEKDIKSHINDLEDKVSSFKRAISELEPSEAIEKKKSELASMQADLRDLENQKTSQELLLKRIQSLPRTEKLDVEKVKYVYNTYKDGLGDLVASTFDDVLAFREEVESYQDKLSFDKQAELSESIDSLSSRTREIRSRISEIYKILNISDKVDDFTTAIEIHQSSKRELDLLSTKYVYFNEKKARKQELERLLSEYLGELNANMFDLQKTIQSFESDLKRVHDAVAGNKKCQFELIVDDSSEKYVQANYRIDLDGSAGINRLATFMYDLLLMTNKYTSSRHPGFLVHDNIFPLTSRDDMVKSLNYVDGLSQSEGFQYIVTLNKDEFESRISDLDFDYNSRTVKVLTRQNKLWGRDYSEVK